MELTFGSLFYTAALENGTESQNQILRRTGVKCQHTQTEFLMILKQVYDDGQNCAPCPECDKTVKRKLVEAEAKLQRKQRAFEDLTAGTLWLHHGYPMWLHDFCLPGASINSLIYAFSIIILFVRSIHDPIQSEETSHCA